MNNSPKDLKIFETFSTLLAFISPPVAVALNPRT
jgi:hypothetical protein